MVVYMGAGVGRNAREKGRPGTSMLATGREPGSFTRPEDPGVVASGGQNPGERAGVSVWGSWLWMGGFKGHGTYGGRARGEDPEGSCKWESASWEGWVGL